MSAPRARPAALSAAALSPAGFRLLADGDSVEVVLGQQGGTMCYLRYGVPADVTSAVTASVNVALDGYDPFDRGPFIGAADAEPGAPGLVTPFHRVLFGDLSLG